MNELTLIDLFSGIGGFSLAGDRAGFRTVCFSEVNPYASAVLRKHWPDVPNLGDITKEDFGSRLNNCIELDMAPRNPKYDGAVELYDSGMSLSDIAEFYHITRQAMWKILIRRGASMRPQKRTGISNHFFRGGNQTGDETSAGKLVAKAISSGKLAAQPCEVCGGIYRFKDGKNGVQAHHDDYNYPLKVRWLCQHHHFEWHQNNQPIRKEVKEANPNSVTVLTGGFP